MRDHGDGWTEYAPLDEEGVEVPDATYGDGDDAWTAVEDEGLTPVLVDGGDDPGFDDMRDGTGCDVVDQFPAAGEIVAEGDEVEISIDCAQVDWEYQEGSTWEVFSGAYAIAFDDACQALFDESPDGSFYEDDYEYTASDCQALNPGDASSLREIPSDVPADPETAAAELGEIDGCEALFDEGGVWSLNWGGDSITVEDCPIGGYYLAPDPAPTESSGRSAPRAGAKCEHEQADGTRVTIESGKGKINCEGAQALWQEFVARAPAEGSGSSGFTELEGWGCAGASAAQAPRAGGCKRLDGTAAFTVFTDE